MILNSIIGLYLGTVSHIYGLSIVQAMTISAPVIIIYMIRIMILEVKLEKYKDGCKGDVQ